MNRLDRGAQLWPLFMFSGLWEGSSSGMHGACRSVQRHAKACMEHAVTCRGMQRHAWSVQWCAEACRGMHGACSGMQRHAVACSNQSKYLRVIYGYINIHRTLALGNTLLFYCESLLFSDAVTSGKLHPSGTRCTRRFQTAIFGMATGRGIHFYTYSLPSWLLFQSLVILWHSHHYLAQQRWAWPVAPPSFNLSLLQKLTC